jgi:hypothetical protein
MYTSISKTSDTWLYSFSRTFRQILPSLDMFAWKGTDMNRNSGGFFGYACGKLTMRYHHLSA